MNANDIIATVKTTSNASELRRAVSPYIRGCADTLGVKRLDGFHDAFIAATRGGDIPLANAIGAVEYLSAKADQVDEYMFHVAQSIVIDAVKNAQRSMERFARPSR